MANRNSETDVSASCFPKAVALAGRISGRGGVQTHLKGLRSALAERGHSVSIVSLDDDEPSGPDIPSSQVLWTRRGGSSRRLGAPQEIVRYLRTTQPDVYIACGTGFNLFIPPLLANLRAKLVFFEVMSGRALGWFNSRWVAANFFDFVVAQAHPVRELFSRSFHYAGRIDVLPAFSDPLEKASVCLPQHNIRVGKPAAAVFGRLVPHKRAFWLVQQWARLRAFLSELHVFGSGPEEDLIRQWIFDRNLEGEVFAHGEYPSGAEYARLISSFDMTLLPTIGEEGAPLVLLESMACGVPFVACDVGGIRDYSNQDCIVCPADPPELFIASVEAMALMIHERRVNRCRLQMFYVNNFSFDALSVRWNEWLKHL